LLQAYAPALALYPEGEWLQVEERVRDLLKHQPEARMWVLRMMSSAVECAPDSQGRILIPARLKEAAQLDTQIMLVGAIDKIEIWNPNLFDTAVAQDAEQFGQYAPKIFR
jgi:MraZ protein